MMSSDTYKLIGECMKYYEKPDSLAHDWLHVRKVASGAKFFVKAADGTPREEELAFVGGLLHDLTREKHETVDHDISGAEMAENVLKDYKSFSGSEVGEIVKSIRDHRESHLWDSKVHSSVFLADKLFEHMGPYIAFRGGFWVGESGNIHEGEDPTDKTLIYYNRTKPRVFSADKYPNDVRGLFDYQMRRVNEFDGALNAHEEWAIDLNSRMVSAGRRGMNLERTILSFEPNHPKQAEYLKEAKDYILDENMSKFASMMPKLGVGSPKTQSSAVYH